MNSINNKSNLTKSNDHFRISILLKDYLELEYYSNKIKNYDNKNLAAQLRVKFKYDARSDEVFYWDGEKFNISRLFSDFLIFKCYAAFTLKGIDLTFNCNQELKNMIETYKYIDYTHTRIDKNDEEIKYKYHKISKIELIIYKYHE